MASHSIWDLDGRSLELVSGNASRTESDWVWLDGQPVAQFTDSYDAAGTYQGTTVTYLYADHLGTPRIGTDENKAMTWRYQSDAFGVGTPSGTASVRLRLPGQIDLGILGVRYNYYRDYDPQVGRYVESDPIGLKAGVNTYSYVGGNPVSRKDPIGLMCTAGLGCYTTPAEAAAAQSGNYQGYYQLACAGGDAYACFAGHVAANDNFWGHRATNRLVDRLRKKAQAAQQCLNEEGILDQIRKDLAKDYASYLPNSPSQARWPSAQDVAQFHWNEFGQFDLPQDTFGGTPYGRNGPPVPLPLFQGPFFLPGTWCPNCTL
ncbi:MAG: RHS repeat-associated core domain-containing protein [Gammaproteobacteria bacterium]|nr:RHS repeat-associated core domain-containing protein [Gammaproteobacteria bacterium]